MRNAEQLIIEAAEAIEIHLKANGRSCRLGILNSKVIAIPLGKMEAGFKEVRTVTPWQCVNGFTPDQWAEIGDALFSMSKVNVRL